jgi:Family of unknown function (DUF5995)
VTAQTIDQVIARLQALDQTLPPSDGVRWFNRLYLDVTLAIRTYCQPGQLAAPPFLEDLTVHFGNVYLAVFDAAAAGNPLPENWAPLFEARQDPLIAPLQFAVAGMNAHIVHDLPLGVIQISQSLGVVPSSDSPQHQDYEAVSTILGPVEEKTKHWLLTGALKELDHDVAPVPDMVAVWSIKRAREAAWLKAEVVWPIRDQTELFNAYFAALDATAAMECRALLLPRLL